MQRGELARFCFVFNRVNLADRLKRGRENKRGGFACDEVSGFHIVSPGCFDRHAHTTPGEGERNKKANLFAYPKTGARLVPMQPVDEPQAEDESNTETNMNTLQIQAHTFDNDDLLRAAGVKRIHPGWYTVQYRGVGLHG